MDCSALWRRLLSPLEKPEIQQILAAAPYLAGARKLDLASYVRLHIACQLLSLVSWRNAVVTIGAMPAARQEVLPACAPRTKTEQQRQRHRQTVAAIKGAPAADRWQLMLAALQAMEPEAPDEDLRRDDPISPAQLSRAQQEVPEEFWAGLVQAVWRDLSGAAVDKTLDGVGTARAYDATTFSLPPSFTWAAFRNESAGAKVLVEFNLATGMLRAPLLTEAVANESPLLDEAGLEPGTTNVFDRGFFDLERFEDYCRCGVYFVTRLKSNTVVKVLKSRDVPLDTNVVTDQEVRLGGGTNRMDHPRRLVTVRAEDGKKLRLISNRMDLPAKTIARLYRMRWHIELFFRWLKHHFVTLHFFGFSRNAVYAQISAAFIAHMLLLHLHRESRFQGSLLDLARYVAARLFAPALERNAAA